MSITAFVWFVVAIVVVVGVLLGLAWALEYMGTPERPKRILMVVAVVIGVAFLIAYALQLLGGMTLFPLPR